MEKLYTRGIHIMEVTVAEAPLQQATFRCRIPKNEEQLANLERPRSVQPSPCFPANE